MVPHLTRCCVRDTVNPFVNGNPSFPIILGSLYSGKHAPPFKPDAPNTHKGIITSAQLKIVMDDVKKSVCISTPGGHVITLSDDARSITIVDSNVDPALF